MKFMPYKDKEKQRAYQNQWIKDRRQEWLKKHGPCKKCGSWENLEVDHIDPKLKGTHKIWSYRREKRDAELTNCQALCYECHKAKSKLDGITYQWKRIARTPAFPIARKCRSSERVEKKVVTT